MKEMLEKKYKTTIHIDNKMILRTVSGSKEIEDYPLSGNPETWSREALDILAKINNKR